MCTAIKAKIAKAILLFFISLNFLLKSPSISQSIAIRAIAIFAPATVIGSTKANKTNR
jgi:hypothetical protein